MIQLTHEEVENKTLEQINETIKQKIIKETLKIILKRTFDLILGQERNIRRIKKIMNSTYKNNIIKLEETQNERIDYEIIEKEIFDLNMLSRAFGITINFNCVDNNNLNGIYKVYVTQEGHKQKLIIFNLNNYEETYKNAKEIWEEI